MMDLGENDESFCDRYFKDVTQQMRAHGSLEARSEEFNYLTDNTDRVKFALNLDAVHDAMQLPSTDSSTRKSSELSVKYRNEGNKKFQEKDYKAAYNLYTKSIIHAPANDPGTEEETHQSDLALAYANRSAALFHLQKHKECLMDIQRSFSMKYPQDLHYKLYDRQAKCLLALKQNNSAITAFENAKNSLSFSTLPIKKRVVWEKDIAKGLQLCKELASDSETTEFTLTSEQSVRLPEFRHGSGEKYTSLADSCSVKYHEGEGRFVVAEGNLDPGDVVLIEKPFASVLLKEHAESHCHHCFVRLSNAIACFKCTAAIFCGERCRDQAWKSYHMYECDILQAIHKSGVGKFGHLALRTVTIKGAEFFYHFRQNLSKEFNQDAQHLGCNDVGQYNSQDYLPIYHLVGHSDQRTPNDIFIRTLTAVFLLQCLRKNGFFKSDFPAAEDEEEIVSFIGGLILSHLQSFPCNAHEISELVLDKNNVATSTCQELGAGIYATLSLFNHSCNPSATRFFYGNTCVVRALKPVAPGSQVSDNYGAVFAVHTKAERQAKLKPQYFFTCQCQACVEDWPLYDKIECDKPTWLCSQCKAVQPNSVMENTQMGPCKKCGIENNLITKKQAVSQATECYYSGLAKLLECNVDVACIELRQALSGLHKQLALPWRDVNNAEEALKQCYNCTSNCYVLEG